MIKAEGTREEWKEFIKECKQSIITLDSTEDGIMEEISRYGWITKPKWKQAYDDLVNYFSPSFYYIQKLNLIHDHILDLEKKLEEK